MGDPMRGSCGFASLVRHDLVRCHRPISTPKPGSYIRMSTRLGAPAKSSLPVGLPLLGRLAGGDEIDGHLLGPSLGLPDFEDLLGLGFAREQAGLVEDVPVAIRENVFIAGIEAEKLKLTACFDLGPMLGAADPVQVFDQTFDPETVIVTPKEMR
ncbi:hypothetical protein [Phytohabitans aurantiacus]|nr:hypothetical protein [Phytohabitans aurantiacus]